MKFWKTYTIFLLCVLLCSTCGANTQHSADNSHRDEESELIISEAPEDAAICKNCVGSFYESENFPFPFPEELEMIEQYGEDTLVMTLDQALYDYDTMWQLLEDNFPFFPYIETELGVEWENVKAVYREEMKTVAEQGIVSQEKFITVIDTCLAEFSSVGHLFTIQPQLYGRFLKEYEEREASPYESIYTLINNAKSEQFYKSYAALSGVSADENIGNVIAPVIETDFKNGIPYLRVPSFSGWTDDTYSQILDFIAEVSGAEHLIIDIRGNRGGSTAAWMNGLVAPLISESLSYTSYMGVKTGALNLFMNPKLVVDQEQYTVHSSDRWVDFLPEKYVQYAQEIDAIVESVSTILPLADHEPCQFEKVWLLVDERCYSASDQFAHFCKTTGFATLVGTFTGGNGIGAQPFVAALPNTGLCIYYEAYLGFNYGGGCNGILGTAPDVYSSTSKNALTVCLNAIAEAK